ncbi:MAG: hypothetical protein KAR07_08620 [Spirochaetes bacterium]|nr:hypothetical protein [Spirochaetota bacterium]
MSYFKKINEFWMLMLPWRLYYCAIFLLILFLPSALIFNSAIVLFFILPFFTGILLVILFLPFFASEGSISEVEIMIKHLSSIDKSTVNKISVKTGFSEKKVRQLILGLIELDVLNLAYHQNEKTVYVFKRSSGLMHCPYCACDFEMELQKKCHNCRVVFSRVVGRKMYNYRE